MLAAAAAALTVVSYNVRLGVADDGPNAWPLRQDLFMRSVAALNADILGVQEAYDFQIDAVRVRFPGYAHVGVGREDGLRKGEFSAIFYRTDRLDRLAHGTFWLSDTPTVPNSMTWGNRITRIVTWGTFRDRKTGREFDVLNTHWDHQSQPARLKSAFAMARFLEARPIARPVLVLGDMNANERNPAIRFLLTPHRRPLARADRPQNFPRLFSTYRVIHPRAPEPSTFHAFTGQGQSGKIDHVLASREWTVEAADVDRTQESGRYPSDHFAVWARVRLGPSVPTSAASSARAASCP